MASRVRLPPEHQYKGAYTARLWSFRPRGSYLQGKTVPSFKGKQYPRECYNESSDGHGDWWHIKGPCSSYSAIVFRMPLLPWEAIECKQESPLDNESSSLQRRANFSCEVRSHWKLWPQHPLVITLKGGGEGAEVFMDIKKAHPKPNLFSSDLTYVPVLKSNLSIQKGKWKQDKASEGGGYYEPPRKPRMMYKGIVDGGSSAARRWVPP